MSWLSGKGVQRGFYPLRPELIESIYYHYQSTGDRSWLLAGRLFLQSIQNSSHSDCGYAALESGSLGVSAMGGVSTLHLVDVMPSFFLAETCKYLYLLFDENNFIHSRPFIFTTEAHPFDMALLKQLSKKLHRRDDDKGQFKLISALLFIYFETILNSEMCVKGTTTSLLRYPRQ